ncbi:MAG: heterodisulfide reductase-related iron-sulfur binding cluster [Candidatus Methanomethylophilaceae archaeon]|jgi:Fe-S oxidoreductase|nr:heterodisulfide reductase-related iron-sulfur binding cluster [Candidatus Methanomethylophilaceae archaeon]
MFDKMPRIQREMTACVQCGYCIDVCEAHDQTPWESVTPRGKIYYLTQLDKRGAGAMDKLLGRDVSVSPEFVDAIYKCTGCGNCEAVCHANIHLVEFWEKIRAWLVAEGVAPLSAHKKLAESIGENRNPYGESPTKRDAWWPAEVERCSVPDVIFFAGCTGSYRMQGIAQAGVRVLDRAGVRMNCLGEEEYCCTSPAIRTGTLRHTAPSAEAVVNKADAMGAKDMVMTCSGCYKTVSHDFGNFFAKPGQNVYHFTQYVDRLISQRKLPLNHEFKAKVTYHDPCHLGRHAGVFEEPRNILKKIKGMEFVEMYRHGMNSRCCGAGGGYKSQFNDFAVNVAAERIRDAEEVGAEVLITSCPFCVLNLTAGAKKIGSNIKVMDISQLLLQVTAPAEPKPVEEKKAAAEPAKAREEPKTAPAEERKPETPADRASDQVADTPALSEEIILEEDPEEMDFEPIEFDEGPETLLRRAAWNKGLRCRKNYGPFNIEIAFVKSKVAVCVYKDEPDTAHDAELENEGWMLLKFKESDITDGEEQAVQIRAAVKENLRNLKKAAKKRM